MRIYFVVFLARCIHIHVCADYRGWESVRQTAETRNSALLPLAALLLIAVVVAVFVFVIWFRTALWFTLGKFAPSMYMQPPPSLLLSPFRERKRPFGVVYFLFHKCLCVFSPRFPSLPSLSQPLGPRLCVLFPCSQSKGLYEQLFFLRSTCLISFARDFIRLHVVRALNSGVSGRSGTFFPLAASYRDAVSPLLLAEESVGPVCWTRWGPVSCHLFCSSLLDQFVVRSVC